MLSTGDLPLFGPYAVRWAESQGGEVCRSEAMTLYPDGWRPCGRWGRLHPSDMEPDAPPGLVSAMRETAERLVGLDETAKGCEIARALGRFEGER